MSFTLYDMLGVSSSASIEEIKTAYKKLAKKYHPDKNQGSSWHEEQFKRINQVYQILSDPQQKRLYDSRLEFEAFQRQNPQPRTNPNPTYKTTEQKKRTPNYNRPPVSRPTYRKSKKYEITISNKKLNLLVVGYYVIAIFLLGSYYEFQDYLKKQHLISEAVEHEKTGRYDYAISSYSQALKFDKDDAEIYERRGIARIKESMDLIGALTDFSYAISNSYSPSDSLLYKHAKCLFLLKDYPLAIVDYETIIENDDSKLDSVYYYKAESNFQLNKYSLAIPDFNEFISLNPNAGQAHHHRGFSYYKNRDYKHALSDYTKTISWQPENGEHYYYRGVINFALKDSTNGCVDLNNSFLLGYTESLELKNKYCD
jgi:curved DNA-binding protein CbpA